MSSPSPTRSSCFWSTGCAHGMPGPSSPLMSMERTSIRWSAFCTRAGEWRASNVSACLHVWVSLATALPCGGRCLAGCLAAAVAARQCALPFLEWQQAFCPRLLLFNTPAACRPMETTCFPCLTQLPPALPLLLQAQHCHRLCSHRIPAAAAAGLQAARKRWRGACCVLRGCLQDNAAWTTLVAVAWAFKCDACAELSDDNIDVTE